MKPFTEKTSTQPGRAEDLMRGREALRPKCRSLTLYDKVEEDEA